MTAEQFLHRYTPRQLTEETELSNNDLADEDELQEVPVPENIGTNTSNMDKDDNMDNNLQTFHSQIEVDDIQVTNSQMWLFAGNIIVDSSIKLIDHRPPPTEEEFLALRKQQDERRRNKNKK